MQRSASSQNVLSAARLVSPFVQPLRFELALLAARRATENRLAIQVVYLAERKVSQLDEQQQSTVMEALAAASQSLRKSEHGQRFARWLEAVITETLQAGNLEVAWQHLYKAIQQVDRGRPQISVKETSAMLHAFHVAIIMLARSRTVEQVEDLQLSANKAYELLLDSFDAADAAVHLRRAITKLNQGDFEKALREVDRATGVMSMAPFRDERSCDRMRDVADRLQPSVDARRKQ